MPVAWRQPRRRCGCSRASSRPRTSHPSCANSPATNLAECDELRRISTETCEVRAILRRLSAPLPLRMRDAELSSVARPWRAKSVPGAESSCDSPRRARQSSRGNGLRRGRSPHGRTSPGGACAPSRCRTARSGTAAPTSPVPAASPHHAQRNRMAAATHATRNAIQAMPCTHPATVTPSGDPCSGYLTTSAVSRASQLNASTIAVVRNATRTELSNRRGVTASIRALRRPRGFPGRRVCG